MRLTLLSLAGLGALLASPASAFFRMPCGQNIVTERADPLVFPGVVSPHVHQINGGNGFGFTETYADARKATCTSCEAAQDLSNYWTPILYYQAQDGNLTLVPQNGMTVYYLQRGTDTNITAFPEGFRMIAGNPFLRNYTDTFAQQAISFVCLDYSGSGAGGEWNYLPTHACPDGVRAQVFFPSCWDGVNLDSADHESHMSYPETGAYNGGTCPSSHPVQLISIFFEVIFDTSTFTFWDGNYNTNQPFVFAMGDPTGYGFHGDFISGWDVSLLQSAVDTCTNDSGLMTDCAVLDLQTGAEMSACTIPVSVDEDITGPFEALPGCNPIIGGPALAVPVTDCPVTPISGPIIPYTDMTSEGWAYQGCAPDNVNNRTLTGTNNIYSTNQATTDVSTCIATCAGYTYAGLEYGKQCFCGNSIPASAVPQADDYGSCNMPCAGNSSQYCGGSSQLSLYKACTSSSDCVNVAYEEVGNISASQPSSSSSPTSSASTGDDAVTTSSAASASSTATSTTKKSKTKTKTKTKSKSKTKTKTKTKTKRHDKRHHHKTAHAVPTAV